MKLLILVAAGLPLAVAAQKKDSVWIIPAQPQPGGTVTIHATTGPTGGFYVLDKKSQAVAHDLTLQKDGAEWTATATLPDTAVAIVANVMDAGAKVLAVTSLPVYGTDGQPLRESFKAMTTVYSQTGNTLFGMPEDDDKLKASAHAYWAGFTTPPTAFGERLSYYLSYKKDTPAAVKVVTAMPLEKNLVENDYAQAIFLAAKVFKNRALSDLLTNLEHQQFPLGDWKRAEFYHQLIAAHGAAAKERIFTGYMATCPPEAPSTSIFRGTYTDVMITQVASAYAKEGDLDKALRFIPAGNADTKAQSYNEIAWQACLAGVSLPQATALSKASLDTLLSLEHTGAGKPDNLTQVQYVRNLKASYTMYADTYAFLLYKTGDYKNAFKYEGIAMGSGEPDKEIIERYHMMMEKVARPSKVLASLSSYIAKGVTDSAMNAQYIRLHGTGGEEALAALAAKANASKQAEMIKTILHDPASGFVLRDVSGNQVSLDSYRGKTVILDFWATWCGPCKASFPAMQKVVDKHKADDNVVLLFIDTWENNVDDKVKNARDFISSNPYTFHVLMDNDNKVVENYKVTGIPTKFIVDPNGVVRFKVVGFNGDTDGTVRELDEMIQLAAKP
ncbi:MAG TPA: TlpA disulfide reductase family protein [Dinghuibacter sp.]|uniref:TlpA family protein disulfide reductase n=1 Tax=Dinghuibacter sp. TaxID=2024697 RepID=UPI002C2680E5|nr:TlpA disulfide reductase family protein [Dinghuibacter sp.]HTJ10630.1 TlpA disulfide reductase family protein [Dinghuibacter sp.]